MLTMVLSRITISWATPNTARIHHRRLWLAAASVGPSPGPEEGSMVVVSVTSASVRTKRSTLLRFSG